jgi:hypothetical protein
LAAARAAYQRKAYTQATAAAGLVAADALNELAARPAVVTADDGATYLVTGDGAYLVA